MADDEWGPEEIGRRTLGSSLGPETAGPLLLGGTLAKAGWIGLAIGALAVGGWFAYQTWWANDEPVDETVTAEHEGFESEGSVPTDTGQGPGQETSITTEALLPAQTFTVEDNQGYTQRIDVSGLTITTDVASAPPGKITVHAAFDFVITNTTPRRDLLVTGTTFFLAAKTPDCGPAGRPPGLASDNNYCKAPIALVPPDGNVTLGPGEAHSGHADSTVDRNWDGGRFMVTVNEALPAEAIYFGIEFLGCQEPCWISPEGAPVPPDL